MLPGATLSTRWNKPEEKICKVSGVEPKANMLAGALTKPYMKSTRLEFLVFISQ